MSIDIIPRLKNYIFPLYLCLISVKFGFITILELIFQELRPFDVLSLKKWENRMFSRFWLYWGPISTSRDGTSIEETAGQAYGVILDVGPGSGQTIKYLDKSKITKVYGVEPCVELHDQLREEIRKNGLEDVYTIVGCGIEDLHALETQYGIRPGTIDTIVAIKVLCGVPNPEITIKNLHSLLQPYGELFVYEHVASKDMITSKVQWLYQLFWPKLFAGCNINRPTEEILRNAGDWLEVDLGRKKGEVGWEVIPHLQGKLVKGEM